MNRKPALDSGLEESRPDATGLIRRARTVLTRLPADQREIVILLGYYRLSRDEIGALLGQPVAHIDAVFRAAVRSLRNLLGSPRHASLA